MSTDKMRPSHILVILSCCGLAAASIGICSNSLGVFFSAAAGDLGVGRGAYAFTATLTALTQGFMSPVVARLMGKYRLRLIALAGVIIACVTTALMGLTRSMPLAYALSALRGVGTALFCFIPINAVLGNWFHRSQGLIVGMVMSFSGLGGAIFNPIFSSLIARTGWANSYLIMSLIIAALALPGALYLRLTPHEAGIAPYGGDDAQTSKAAEANSGKRAKSILGPAFILVSVFAVSSTAVTAIGQHFSGFAESVGLGTATGAMMISAAMIGNIVSKLIIGALTDRVGAIRAAMVMVAVSAVAILMILFSGGSAKIVSLAGAALYGAIYSIGAVGIPLVVRHVFGNDDFSNVYSLVSVLTSIGSALALTLVGSVYDAVNSYNPVFICAAAIGLMNIVLLALLSRKGLRDRRA